jgi:large subunit ribosomal protein L13
MAERGADGARDPTTAMTRTTFATRADHDVAAATWHLVDAAKYPLGRMAARIAEVLMGKTKPLYTPHLLVGDGVIVVNAARVVTTGRKNETREHTRWTGYPGGLRRTTLGADLANDPCWVVKRAVRRMLPKSRLGRTMLSRLKVYPGAEHAHAAQQPRPLEFEI